MIYAGCVFPYHWLFIFFIFARVIEIICQIRVSVYCWSLVALFVVACAIWCFAAYAQLFICFGPKRIFVNIFTPFENVSKLSETVNENVCFIIWSLPLFQHRWYKQMLCVHVCEKKRAFFVRFCQYLLHITVYYYRHTSLYFICVRPMARSIGDKHHLLLLTVYLAKLEATWSPHQLSGYFVYKMWKLAVFILMLLFWIGLC